MSERENVRQRIIDILNSAYDTILESRNSGGQQEERLKIEAENKLLKVMELLEAQEPCEDCISREMTLEEVKMHVVYWIEQKDVCRPWPTAMHHIRNAGLLDGPVYQDYIGENWNTKEYGVKWRCWTSHPTDAQREATPWP